MKKPRTKPLNQSLEDSVRQTLRQYEELHVFKGNLCLIIADTAKTFRKVAPTIDAHTKGIHGCIIEFVQFAGYALFIDDKATKHSKENKKEARQLQGLLTFLKNTRRKLAEAKGNFELQLHIRQASGKAPNSQRKINKDKLVLTGQNVWTVLSTVEREISGYEINADGSGGGSGYIIGRRRMLRKLFTYLKIHNVFMTRPDTLIYLYRICEVLEVKFWDKHHNPWRYPKDDIENKIIDSIESDLKIAGKAGLD